MLFYRPMALTATTRRSYAEAGWRVCSSVQWEAPEQEWT